MRLAVAGDACWRGVSSSSSSSTAGGSSGVVCAQHRPLPARVTSCRASPLQHQLPKDPPSAYYALRQQLGQQQAGDSSSISDSGGRQRQHRWPRPADDVCKAVSKRLKQADSVGAVLQVVQHHGTQFNTINTALAFAQLARHLRFETSSSRSGTLQHSSYLALQQLAAQQVGEMNPRQVAMVLTSLAWMQCPAEEAGTVSPPPAQAAAPAAAAAAAVMPDIMQAAADSIGSSEGAGNSAAAHQQQQQLVLLEGLSQRLEVLLDSFEPDDTCHCLWALSKLGALQPQLLAAATAHGLSRGWLHMLTAKPLSSLLWVHAQAHLQQQQQVQQQLQQQQGVGSGESGVLSPLVGQLVAAVMHEVSQPGFLATWTPQELSMLLWSCAVLGVPLQQQQQQQQLAKEAAVQLPAPVLQEVCQLARQHVVQFTPQGTAMLCWSLGQLLGGATAPQHPSSQQQLGGLSPSLQQAVLAVFDTFTAAAAARLQYYKPQEVCNIFTACSRLQRLPAGLRAVVEGYVGGHTHLLGCRDVTDLLLAAGQLHGPAQQQQRRQGPGLGPVAVRALLHRVGQLAPELNGFQQAAAAWVCVRVAQLQDSAESSSGSSSSMGAARRSTGGSLSSSHASTLQEECLSMAAHLLSSLDQQTAAVVAAAAAVGGDSTASGADAASSSGMRSSAAAWDSLLGGGGDLKQAVALAWAIAATAVPPGMHAAATLGTVEQQQQPAALLGAVLHRLHKGVQSCDAAALVQVLCVLVRLRPVVASTGSQQQQQHRPMLLRLRGTALARLPGLLPQLPAAEAATAAWAAVKLQVLLGRSPGTQELVGISTAPGAVSVLSAALTQLHQQQQLCSVPTHSVAALLWCFRVTQWVPPAAVYGELLRAADAKLLQLHTHQQVMVLQAVAEAAPALPLRAPAAPGGAQQLQQQQGRLLLSATEQLQVKLHQQSLQLAWQAEHPDAAAASSLGRQRLVSTAAAAAEQTELQPHDLLTVAAACKALQPLPSSMQLVQQVVEVWQLLQQQGAVSVRQALLMVWHLADVLPNSPAQPWHAAVLQQEQLLLRGSAGSGSRLLPQLLHRAAAALNASLSASTPDNKQQQGVQAISSASTLVLALRVFGKLRYQPPSQLLAPLLQQLQAALPALPQAEVTAALVAVAQLAVPAPQLTAAVLSELQHRQASAPQQAAAAGGFSQGRPSRLDSVALLWALLCGACRAGAAGSEAIRPAGRLLSRLAVSAADVPPQQLLQQPQLLLMSQQAWRMLYGLRQHQHIRRALQQQHQLGLPKPLLPQQLQLLTQLLLPSGVVGHAREQLLLQLLCADQHQQRFLLQQRICGAAAAAEQQALLQQCSSLLPLWLQYQLQKRCQERLARELVHAQLASGFAAADVRLRCLPSGEVALLLRPQKHSQPTQQQQTLQEEWLQALRHQQNNWRLQQQQLWPGAGQHSGAPEQRHDSASEGVAVVLETPNNVAVNTGQLLGAGAARDALLRAEGYRVVSVPLHCWLPDFVVQQQHAMLLQPWQEQPGKLQHQQKLVWKRLRKFEAARKRHLQQLLEALYHCS